MRRRGCGKLEIRKKYRKGEAGRRGPTPTRRAMSHPTKRPRRIVCERGWRMTPNSWLWLPSYGLLFFQLSRFPHTKAWMWKAGNKERIPETGGRGDRPTRAPTRVGAEPARDVAPRKKAPSHRLRTGLENDSEAVALAPLLRLLFFQLSRFPHPAVWMGKPEIRKECRRGGNGPGRAGYLRRRPGPRWRGRRRTR